jgi:hypothetical protein
MTVDKQNPTQQRQQPLSLSDARTTLPLSTGDLGLPVRRIPNSRRRDDSMIEQQAAFLRSILQQAIELANDAEYFFPEDSISECTDDVEENSRNQN